MFKSYEDFVKRNNLIKRYNREHSLPVGHIDELDLENGRCKFSISNKSQQIVQIGSLVNSIEQGKGCVSNPSALVNYVFDRTDELEEISKRTGIPYEMVKLGKELGIKEGLNWRTITSGRNIEHIKLEGQEYLIIDGSRSKQEFKRLVDKEYQEKGIDTDDIADYKISEPACIKWYKKKQKDYYDGLEEYELERMAQDRLGNMCNLAECKQRLVEADLQENENGLEDSVKCMIGIMGHTWLDEQEELKEWIKPNYNRILRKKGFGGVIARDGKKIELSNNYYAYLA